MKHMQLLHATRRSTTHYCNPSIRHRQTPILKLGRLFTLLLATFLLGNLNVQAQCGGPLPATDAHCVHPATNVSPNLMTINTNANGDDYVDVNSNGSQETIDGLVTDLTTADCGGTIYSGSILSGATYGFELNTGVGYTFKVCGVDTDIYPLLDLWQNLAASSSLEATSTHDGTTCVTMGYVADYSPVYLNVNSQVHGNTCQADWREWTLEVECASCEITCGDDIYVSATGNTGGNCEADKITIEYPTISDICNGTITIINSNLPTTVPALPTTVPAGGTQMFTGSFAVGVYFIEYQTEDCDGNTHTCRQYITVEPVMVCNDEVNVTLGASCTVMITADMVIEAPCADDSDYEVTILNATNPITEPGTYTVKVEYAPASGSGSGIYCWGTVNVEDKTGPTCNLENDCYTAFCGSDIEVDTPIFSDCTGVATDTVMYDQSYGSCGEYDGDPIDLGDVNGDGHIDVFEGDGIWIPTPCETPTDFTLDNIVVRTWQVSDVLGNGSTSCRAYIYNWRPENSAIIAPDPTVELECLSELSVEVLAAADPTYVPHFPDPFNPGEFLPMLSESHTTCKYSVSYSDTPLVDLCGQTKKVLREWTVLDWCDGNWYRTYTQIIKTVDTTAPEWLTCPAATDLGGSADNPLTLNSSSSSEDNCYFYGLLAAPLATDACGTVTYTASVRNNNNVQISYISDLSQPAQIDFGAHKIVYLATDDCGNVAECCIYYDIIDDDKPIAICDEYTTVSLTNAINGGARICAENLDSGSYDNCGITDRKVKRMDADEAVPFTDCIDLTCDDTGAPILVRMRVYDAAGNYNECMVQVEVQDKIGPFLTCPADVEVTCTDDIYDLSLTGTVIEGTSSPVLGGGFAFDNCTLDSITYVTNVSELNCGAGTATRIWTAHSNGNTESCTQTITISSINSFRVEFPKDTTITSCVDPANLGDFGAPIISDDLCAQVGVSSSDLQFDVVSGACYKILRTWTVINWCNYDDSNLQNTALGNLVDGTTCTYDDDGDGYFRYTQVIKVQDQVDPEFQNCPTSVIEFPSAQDGCGGTVTLTALATDACTNTLSYEWFIDIDNDGDFDRDGTGNVISDDYVYNAGEHRVVFIAEDGCGNTARCEYNFAIADNKAPGVACKPLSVTLMPGLNMIEMWATDYLADSGLSDNCTSVNDLDVRVVRQSDSDQTIAPTTTNITFDCQDLIITNADGSLDSLQTNEIAIEIWVGDEAGNWAFCTTTTQVTSNDEGCWPATVQGGTVPENFRAMIAGEIANESGEMLEDVTIEINSESSIWDYTTTNDGHYEIGDLPMYDNYVVEPENDVNPLNGVSTYDLVLISQHILGIEEFNTPYKMIAADVNNNGSITTADIVELRQLILYITSDFQNNKSWRFVDASFVFPEPSNPFATAFPEVRSLSNLETDAMTENFVGVKVGDVNGDAVANTLLGTEERNLVGTFKMTANDQLVAAGEEVTVALNAADLAKVAGFQFTLNFDATALDFVEVRTSEATAMSAANFGYNFVGEGMLTASWNKVAATEDLTEVVELTFTAKEDITLSEVLSINSRYTKAEAYDTDMNNMNVALEFNTTNGTVIVDAGFELYQNQPNPFSNETSIGFNLPEAANVTLTIFDVEGRQLKVLSNDFAKGYNQITIGNEDLTSGILYYRLDTPGHSATKKMLVIK